ncbi:MAG: hypothetical protein ACFFB9_03825, partial [Promethearchaeota archaeon]
MNLKSRKKIFKVLIIVVSFLFFLNMFILPVRAEQLTKTTYLEQWIKNPDFDDNADWISQISGDVTDVNNDISAGQANFNVQGETYT